MNNFAKFIIDTYNSSQKIAVCDPTGSLTYQELAWLTRRYAHAFVQRGVQPQQKIIIALDDCKEWPAVTLALLSIGANILLLSPKLSKEEVQLYTNLSNAKAIVCEETLGADLPCILLSELESDCLDPINFYDWHNDEPCLWLLTSGTGGKNQCIVHRHAMFEHNLTMVARSSVMNLSSSAKIYSTAKLYWAWGFCITMIFGLAQGATVCLLPGLVSPRRICDWMEQHSVTHLNTVPTMINSLIKHHAHAKLPSSLKNIFVGGEPLTRTMTARFENLYSLPLCDMFGTSECMQIAYRRPTDAGLVPFDGIVLQLRNVNGMPDSQIGELCVKTAMSALYYYKNYSSSKHTFVGDWTRTGDLLEYNATGGLNYVSRITDLVKIGAVFVDVYDIEAKLLGHDAIDDCCVVGVINQEGLCELHAFVIASDDIDLDIVKNYLQTKVTHIPKVLKRVAELPRTINNKILRKTLRSMCNG